MSHLNIFVAGTATKDHLLYAGDLSENFKNGVLRGKVRLKTSLYPEGMHDRAGGSAVNTTLALESIAKAAGIPLTVYKCMRLGRHQDNSGKDMVLNALGNHGLDDKTLVDSMFKYDYVVPTNTILEHSSDRLVLMRPKIDHTVTEYTKNEIRTAVEKCRLLMCHSKPYQETQIAFERAKELGIPTVLDYSEKDDLEDMLKAVELLRHADYVVAPDDARLPGMKKSNAQELFANLIEQYGCRNVAVSNSDQDVMVFSNGETSKVPIQKVEANNVCGSGDTRDAALAMALAGGYSFFKSIQIASDIATFYVIQPDREAFQNNLPGYLATRPPLRIPTLSHGATQPALTAA